MRAIQNWAGSAARAGRADLRIASTRSISMWAAAATFSLGLTAAYPPCPRLVWNASASSPIGLYAIDPHARLRSGDMAVAWAPGYARRLAAARGYLPLQVPLVKSVAAGEGDRVCARGAIVRINGRFAARRQIRDSRKRQMPSWTGCIRLSSGDVFLLSSTSPWPSTGAISEQRTGIRWWERRRFCGAGERLAPRCRACLERPRHGRASSTGGPGRLRSLRSGSEFLKTGSGA